MGAKETLIPEELLVIAIVLRGMDGGDLEGRRLFLLALSQRESGAMAISPGRDLLHRNFSKCIAGVDVQVG